MCYTHDKYQVIPANKFINYNANFKLIKKNESIDESKYMFYFCFLPKRRYMIRNIGQNKMKNNLILILFGLGESCWR